MKSFNALLRDFCHIPLLDLADAAETNRYRNSIWSFYCVASLIVLFPAVLFIFRNDFAAGLVHFGYFGISFVVSLISLIISITLKNARATGKSLAYKEHSRVFCLYLGNGVFSVCILFNRPSF